MRLDAWNYSVNEDKQSEWVIMHLLPLHAQKTHDKADHDAVTRDESESQNSFRVINGREADQECRKHKHYGEYVPPLFDKHQLLFFEFFA